MAKWAITYNGFGSNGASAAYQWSHVNVSSMQATPVFAEDGISLETTKHTFVGTALLSANTDAAFATLLGNARVHLGSQPYATAGEESDYALYIYLDGEDHADSGTTELAAGKFSRSGESQGVDTNKDTRELDYINRDDKVHYVGSADDDYGLPSCDFTINEMAGTRTAIVSFTITWNKIEPPNASVQYEVLSHVWTQSFDIGEEGLTTITVSGTLRCRFFAHDAASTENEPATLKTEGAFRGLNPDHYRALVMPAIPNGFRVGSMKWATDKTGSILSYTIVLKEHSRGLPWPAKKGSGSFTYKRGLTGQEFLGMKTFEGELEGDSNSDPLELLSSLIKVAASRIFFGGGASPDATTGADMIMSIEVTEKDIFSRKKIGLRITAKGLKDLDPAFAGDPQFHLAKPFFEEGGDLAQSETPNVYGAHLISSVKRQMWFPWDPRDGTDYEEYEIPRSELRLLTEAEDVTEETTVIDEGDMVPSPPGQLQGGEEAGQSSNIKTTEHATKPFVHVNGTESVEVDHRHIVVSGQSIESEDVVFQVGKPVVTVISEYQLTRLGKPPDRLMLSKPANGIVMHESFDVNRGPVDGNNNRQYIGMYRRVVRLLRNSNDQYFYQTFLNLPGYDQVEVWSWWPASLSAPADPRMEPDVGGFGENGRTLFSTPAGRGDEGGGSTTSTWNPGQTPPVYGT